MATPVGFGGAAPGVNILRAVAEGNIQRQQRQQQEQRQAIQQRLQQSRMELMQKQQETAAQRLRLETEKREDERRRMQEQEQAAQETAAVLRPHIVERFDLDPEEAEDLSLETINNLYKAERTDASLEQLEASTTSNRLAAERTRLENQNMRVGNAASELLTQGDVFKIATHDFEEEGTRRKIIGQYVDHFRPDLEDDRDLVIDRLIQAADPIRERMARTHDPAEAAPITADEVRTMRARLQANFGNQAEEHLITQIQQMQEQNQGRGQDRAMKMAIRVADEMGIDTDAILLQ